MKNRLLLLLFLTAFSCRAQESKITKVNISYVDFEIETFYTIKCNDFETRFGKEMKRKTLYDGVLLERLNYFLNKMKPDNEGYIPDVRAKLEIYYNDRKVRVLCMSELGAQLDGKSMLLDKGFVNLIKSMESHK